MKQRRNRVSFVFLICTLISLFVISSCKKTETKQPFPGGLPEQDIVFMPYDPFYSHGKTRKSIGFVNADGSQRNLYKFLVAGGSAIQRPKYFSTYAIEPKWSGDGESLAFYIADVPPHIRIIDKQGYMYGKECVDIYLNDFGFDGKGNIVLWISRTNSLFEDYSDEVEGEEQLFVRYDFKRCQVIEAITVPIPEDNNITGVNISKDGIITCMIKEVVKYTHQEPEEPYSVYIYDIKSGEEQIVPGFLPSLSDDGTKLAYYGYNRELIIRDMESNEEWAFRRIYKYDDFYRWVSRPGWSPDNQWLVYNTRDGEIYKVNVNSGERIYITDGYTPDWR
jgi:hypothetical protein